MSNNNKKKWTITQYIWWFSKNGKMNRQETPQEAIQQLQDMEELLNKKVAHLEEKNRRRIRNCSS